MSCTEVPLLEEDEHDENRQVWIILASTLGLAMVFSGLLDLVAKGVPLGFTVPLLNEPATVSMIIYHAVIITIGTYIGLLGLKELFVERRFSVEFLMSVAAFGAVYLDFLFEAATVLFLYSLAEYFEGYIEDRARKTVEKLSRFMPDKATIISRARILPSHAIRFWKLGLQ
jgi:cation transport ATPase